MSDNEIQTSAVTISATQSAAIQLTSDLTMASPASRKKDCWVVEKFLTNC